MPILLMILGGAKTFFNAALSFFSKPPGSWVGLVLIAGGIVWYAHHSGYNSGKAASDAAYAKIEAHAVEAARVDQAARDKISSDAAVKDAEVQPKIITHYQTITKEIPVHVSDSSHCITYGLVRVLNMAAGAGAYKIPSTMSDDECAPITWQEFAADLVADYQASQQNSQQLGDLQGWVTAQERVESGKR